jgi:hypothetical protein
MTELEALVRCMKLWTWLDTNPLPGKSSYEKKKAAYKALGWIDSPGRSFCPACEYVYDEGRGQSDCRLCPLFMADEQNSEPCMEINSVYRLWARGSSDATGMIDLIKQAINRCQP